MRLRLFMRAYGSQVRTVMNTLALLKAALEAQGVALEVLVAGDASDEMMAPIFEYQAPNITIEGFSPNLSEVDWLLWGYEWALQGATSKDFVACCDTDGKHNPLSIVQHMQSHMLPGFAGSVVGSILYPPQASPQRQVDRHRGLYLGGLLGELAGVSGKLYDVPSYQIRAVEELRHAHTLLVSYVDYYRENWGDLPSEGAHGVVVRLLSHKNVKIKAVQLECLDQLRPVVVRRLCNRATAVLKHMDALELFLLSCGR